MGVYHFITEFKKLDGSDFPGKTLYSMIICIQFHLETKGYSWRLLSNDVFKDVKFTLDNMMKLRTSQGISVSVKCAQVLSFSDEGPEVLLNTCIFLIGKGCALCTSKEHYGLRSPPFNSQLNFLRDCDGQIFMRYSKEIGFKTKKGGLKHSKVEPNEVDVYPIEDEYHCPIRTVLFCLSKLPKDWKCVNFYLSPRKKYEGKSW